MAYNFYFEKLEVWQLSVDLSADVYLKTQVFPEEEKFGLTNQMRRAVVSVSSNLAEGSAKDSPREQARYTQIAYASLMELLSQLIVSKRIGYIGEESFIELRNSIEKLANKINNYRKSQLSRIKEPEIPYQTGHEEFVFTEEFDSTIPQLHDSPVSQLLQTAAYFHHPTAAIDPGARIGPNTRIWHYSHVMSGAEIGADCTLGQNVFVAGGVTIGRGVKVQNNVSLYEGVACEDEVFIGPSAVFTNVFNPRSAVVRKSEYRPTKVGRGASIGANATIICGLTIGAYAFVAAGATVTRDVPPYALVRGVPARQTGWMSEYGCKLTFDGAEDAVCEESGEVYELVDKRIRKVC